MSDIRDVKKLTRQFRESHIASDEPIDSPGLNDGFIKGSKVAYRFVLNFAAFFFAWTALMCCVFGSIAMAGILCVPALVLFGYADAIYRGRWD